MGPSERYLIDSLTHSRCNQFSGRHRVHDNQRPHRLETQSCCLQQDQPHLWAPRGAPVYWLTIKSQIYGSVSGTYMGWYACALIGMRVH